MCPAGAHPLCDAGLSHRHQSSGRESKASQETYTEFQREADFPVRPERNDKASLPLVATIPTRGSCHAGTVRTSGMTCGTCGVSADPDTALCL